MAYVPGLQDIAVGDVLLTSMSSPGSRWRTSSSVAPQPCVRPVGLEWAAR
ncbi:MAG TPA: hypothetical protein VMV92_30330 [Streptosporangiaceae bacterium]|nr:hypothetical protein [Streptosporangiaceae bacterium]